MIFVDGQSNERLVLDGEWFEKLRGGASKTRVPASSFRGAQWSEIERRTRLFGGGKERLVQLTLSFDGGPFVGFVADEGKRAELEAMVARLEAASVRPNA
ncbi:MAG: hypothetical protein HOV71_09430 [Hamadaea sp.]|nr:hypothetical protein [Hamadaea sp.]NUR48341.1 hypothetical protein [Hamadaea sp.]NUR97624.1 hypothetical protein [Kribbellaceae bacterium]NUT04963.1 hypothetical protein [Hamadaea sp.]